MTGFHIQLVDGPAEGFNYSTMVKPDEEIVMAKFPRVEGRPLVSGWCHVIPSEEEPWPQECRYRRGEIPHDAARNDFGELVVRYEVTA